MAYSMFSPPGYGYGGGGLSNYPQGPVQQQDYSALAHQLQLQQAQQQHDELNQSSGLVGTAMSAGPGQAQQQQGGGGPSEGEQIGGAVGGVGGTIVGSYFGGPIGGFVGGAAGKFLGGLFGGLF